MASNTPLSLRSLIGQRVVHRGIPCRVVELLEGESALVLEATGPREGIQDNQYGDPHRRVAETFTLPIFDDHEQTSLHPELLALGVLGD